MPKFRNPYFSEGNYWGAGNQWALEQTSPRKFWRPIMPAKIKIKSLSLDELLVLKVELEAEIAKAAAREVARLEEQVAQLRPLAATRPVVRPAVKPTATPSVKSSAKPAAPRKARAATKSTVRRRRKADIKFRDPKTGATWTGRGRTPIWLREHEAAGKKRATFAVA